MRPPFLIGVGLAIIAILGIVAYWALEWRYLESTDDAYVGADFEPVSAKIAGYAESVFITDNVPVKAGQVLVKIQAQDYAARVAQAAAMRDNAANDLANLNSQIAAQQAIVEQADAERASAEAELHRAKLDQDRYQGLAAYNVASHQRLETAQADLSKARAGLARGDAGIQAAKGQLQVIMTERPGREAALKEAEAALALARIDLENTEIKAGIDGVIGHKAIAPGQYVRPGAVLLTVVPIEAIYVDANFKETQLTRMKTGQKATITVDAYPGIRLSAHVVSFAPASGAMFSLLPPENATGNFTKVVQRIPVRLSLDSKDELDGKLRPGLSVDVTVDTR